MRYFQFSIIFFLILSVSPNALALTAVAHGEFVEGTHVVTVSGFYIEETVESATVK